MVGNVAGLGVSRSRKGSEIGFDKPGFGFIVQCGCLGKRKILILGFVARRRVSCGQSEVGAPTKSTTRDLEGSDERIHELENDRSDSLLKKQI